MRMPISGRTEKKGGGSERKFLQWQWHPLGDLRFVDDDGATDEEGTPQRQYRANDSNREQLWS